MPFCEHADEALAKLIAIPTQDSIAALVDAALEALNYRRDEDAAAKILISILLHDDLAEALDGSL